MRILLFEDDLADQLAPISTSRPCYAISCASFRLIDWLRKLDFPIAAVVRPHLQSIQKAEFGDISDWDSNLKSGDSLLLINARMIPSQENFLALKRWIESGMRGVAVIDDQCAAAIIAPTDLNDITMQSDGDALMSILSKARELPEPDLKFDLFQWPHNVVQSNMQLMNDALEYRIASGRYTQSQDGVFLGPGASIAEYPVIDTSDGPILLDENVKVGPFCYLSGPVYAGPGTRVIEHAALKDAVSLGHTVKIGGEVEASVIEPYTNKQHHGFLGHSYLGSWINLGAGTCNSDLKNTYGKINIEYPSGKVPSEMQFLGCIVGDYAKTAINTGIFTGKVIGVCSMLYGFVTQNVPGFVNYAQIFGQVAEIPPDVMISTQARMFARRNVTQRECDIQLIRDMYEITRHEREQANQVASF